MGVPCVELLLSALRIDDNDGNKSGKDPFSKNLIMEWYEEGFLCRKHGPWETQATAA
jgi:hypothetical protein